MKPALEILPYDFAVCRFNSRDRYTPDFSGRFLSITKTAEEFSIVCEESRIPAGSRSEAGWKCLKVEGPLDFSLTGIIAGISGVLADSGISIFAISTFDTDYILVKTDSLNGAINALKKAGYSLKNE